MTSFSQYKGMIPTSYINGCTKIILRKNSSWRYLNEIQPHFFSRNERTLFIPLHFKEITLQKSGLTCAPYTILLKNVKKKKNR